MPGSDVYLGNPNLKKANTQQEFTEENIIEFVRCKNDPVYFTEKHIKIVNVDEGLVGFDMYKFQKKLIRNFHKNRFNICKMPRQTGKSTTVVSYLLHYAIFNDNVNIGILANKAATSASAVRGMSFNIIFLDEFAFVANHLADDFFASVYPTISSGKSTKVIIVSTPHGMNHFYRMWHDAERGKNEYVATEVHWSEVPGRDAKWKKQTIANTSEQQFQIEFECEFLGSVDTLIAASKLKALVYEDPVKRNGKLSLFETPREGNEYVITVDVARGVGKDYSTFCVFDITNYPYKIVATFRDNEIKPMLFPSIIEEVGRAYNNAHVLCEVNDIGDQVASILFYDLEYENVLMVAMRGRNGQIVGSGFSGVKTQLGVKMSQVTKKVGCSNLKTLIEDDKLIFCDYQIISELTTFIQKKQSFEAEEGCNDDLAMCLVIFAWLVAQDYFKEMTDQDVRKKIYEEQKNAIEQDMAPFGFISDGLDDDLEQVDSNGDNWKVDEYGDRAYMWEYHV